MNAWSDGEDGLEDLIRALDRLTGLARIRYTTSHPADMTEGLIRAHAEVGKLMPYLHLPCSRERAHIESDEPQPFGGKLSGDHRASARGLRPDIAISAICRLPGERRDFAETLKIVEAVNYAQAFSFKYSARPGTPAAAMEDRVPREVMDERLQRLQALLNAQQLAFNQASVGRRTDVLLERAGRKPGQLVGKTPWLQSVHLETDAAIGDIVEVAPVSAGPNSLAGAELTRRAA